MEPTNWCREIMLKIYLSYSAVDRSYAQQVYEHLRHEQSFIVWMDIHELQVTQDWWTACRDARKTADIVVGIASQNAIVLERMQTEWSEAKRLYLVSLIEAHLYATTMPERFTAHNVVFLINDKSLSILANEIKEQLNHD